MSHDDDVEEKSFIASIFLLSRIFFLKNKFSPFCKHTTLIHFHSSIEIKEFSTHILWALFYFNHFHNIFFSLIFYQYKIKTRPRLRPYILDRLRRFSHSHWACESDEVKLHIVRKTFPLRFFYIQKGYAMCWASFWMKALSLRLRTKIFCRMVKKFSCFYK